MSKEILKNLIDNIPDEDLDVIFKILIRFIPEDVPTQDEIKAIAAANRDIAENGTIPHEAINWN